MKDELIKIRISQQDKEDFKKRAEELGMTMSELLLRLIKQELEPADQPAKEIKVYLDGKEVKAILEERP